MGVRAGCVSWGVSEVSGVVTWGVVVGGTERDGRFVDYMCVCALVGGGGGLRLFHKNRNRFACKRKWKELKRQKSKANIEQKSNET